jgi:DNA-binding transcriptional LysR family regulator
LNQLGYLRYFHAVARTRSIRGAAEMLNVAQSAVSRQIKNLESALGVTLFDRHPRGVRLTDAGEILAQYAQQTILSFERARSEIDDLRAMRRGTINVCTVEAGILDIVPQVIANFRRLHPSVKFAVQVGGTQSVVEALLNDESDVGLAFNTPKHPEIQFIARREQRLHAVVSPDHPIARKSSVAMAELKGQMTGLPDPSFGIRQLVDEIRKMPERDEDVFTTNSIQALASFARLKMGVAFLPFFAVRREVEEGRLVAIPLADRAARHTSVDLIVHAGRRLPVAAEEFLTHIQAVLKRLR